MEFFRIINRKENEGWIQQQIQPKTVEDFTETLLFLENDSKCFKGATLWGEFLISYDVIKGGVRFALLDCPNALCWTITTEHPPTPNKIVLHCTINRTEKEAEFIEEIHEFLDEWEEGLIAFKKQD